MKCIEITCEIYRSVIKGDYSILVLLRGYLEVAVLLLATVYTYHNFSYHLGIYGDIELVTYDYFN